jgi:hypothetical protein
MKDEVEINAKFKKFSKDHKGSLFEYENNNKELKTIWLPTSVIKLNYLEKKLYVPRWLFNQKFKDLIL